MQVESEESVIRNFLTNEKLDTWGYVCFRCTYDDDAGWNKFVQILNANTRERLEKHDASDLLDKLDFVIIEDKDTLDGADVATVKQ